MEDIYRDIQRRNRLRWIVCLTGLFLGTAVLFVWNIRAGSVALPVSEIKEILVGQHTGETAFRIIWDIRLPRAIAALLLGGALAVSGFLLQTFFQNPIAGPFVLGISSGAKLTVALAMILLLGSGRTISSTAMILAAFAGSMLCMGFILLLSRKASGMSVLIIGGVMIGYICSAITDFVVTFASDADIVNLHNWSMGTFSGMRWSHVRVMTGVVLAGVLGTFLLSKPITAYQQGESYAQSVGVNTRLFRGALVLLSGILSACVTAFAGPISFVGIAVPHVVKCLLGTSRPILVIPSCFLGGAVCCLFCDLIARTVFAPTEISISSVTAIIGAPVVIWILVRRHRENEHGTTA